MPNTQRGNVFNQEIPYISALILSGFLLTLITDLLQKQKKAQKKAKSAAGHQM
jgi:hypothetical protein